MASQMKCMKELCASLGKQYTTCTIDLEPVIYRDFGNGFNVEICGVYTTSKKKKATIYLWFGTEQPECMIVRTEYKVARENIASTVEMLRDYSDSLIARGFDTRDKIFRHKFKITNLAGGNGGVKYRIFYGSQPSFADMDLENFSRGKYQCKRLLQTKKGMPVVISQCKDKDFSIWKVEYGFSCLVFGRYDDAMEFCKGRFTEVEGRHDTCPACNRR